MFNSGQSTHSCAQLVLHATAQMEYVSKHPVYATLPMNVGMEVMRLDVVSDHSAFHHLLLILLLYGTHYKYSAHVAYP